MILAYTLQDEIFIISLVHDITDDDVWYDMIVNVAKKRIKLFKLLSTSI